MEKNNITTNINKFNEIQKERHSFQFKKRKILNDMSNKKNKGYARIFRNIIKKKNKELKHILINRFKKWKEEAFKGMFIRKTIIVRISVSRDNILKNRKNSSNINRIKDLTENRSKSADKNLKSFDKNDIKEKKINNIKMKNTNENITPKSKKEIKEISDNEPFKRLYINDKIRLLFKKKNNLNPNNNLMNAKKLPYDKITKYIRSLNRQNNMDDNEQVKKIENKNPTPKLYTYEPNKDKIKSKYDKIATNKSNITYNTLTTPRFQKTQGNKSYSNVHSNLKSPINNQLKNKEKQTPNENKIYYDIKNNYSESKLFDKKKSFYHTYSKNNNNKRYVSVDNENKYANFTEKRDKHMKKQIDNEKLKKGITTVIQHYLGVRERFDNYNMMPN